MPNQVDITVKKADGATDITYTKVVPSSGSNSPAIWRSPVGAAAAHRATLSIKSSPNQSNTLRHVEIKYNYPETATGTDGKVSVVNRLGWTWKGTVSMDMSDAVIAEAVAQGQNLLASAHVKDQISSGYAAT